MSVIMPAFNAENTVGLAIKTALAAMSPEDELIVIDDGSSDSTHGIISSFSDTRLSLLANTKNLGIAKSLNMGINEAKNDVIARADADDIVPFWRFKMQTAILIKEEIDFLFGSQILLWGRVPIFPLYSWISRKCGNRFNKAMALSCIVAHPTLMAKKNALIELGGYRNVVAEDYALWLAALSMKYKVYRHWFPQNVYNLSATSVSKRDSSRDGHLKHLREDRIRLFSDSRGQDYPDAIRAMRIFRRQLLLTDTFLCMETGIRSDPLKTL